MTQQADADQREDAGPPPWEWAAAGVGLLLLVSSLGFLAYEAATLDDTPPRPQLQVVGVERQGGHWLLRFRVRNLGSSAAAQLKVEGRLDGPAGESSETSFDYLPGGSAREGGLFFHSDPRGRVQLRARSYQAP